MNKDTQQNGVFNTISEPPHLDLLLLRSMSGDGGRLRQHKGNGLRVTFDPPSKCPGLINIIEKIDSRDIGRERINVSIRQVSFFRAEKEADLMGVNLGLGLAFIRKGSVLLDLPLAASSISLPRDLPLESPGPLLLGLGAAGECCRSNSEIGARPMR